MAPGDPENTLKHDREAGDTSDPALVDVTLIDETLRMTPEERLLLNDRMIRTVAELRSGFGQTQR